jgi:hypothetical protein
MGPVFLHRDGEALPEDRLEYIQSALQNEEMTPSKLISITINLGCGLVVPF